MSSENQKKITEVFKTIYTMIFIFGSNMLAYIKNKNEINVI